MSNWYSDKNEIETYSRCYKNADIKTLKEFMKLNGFTRITHCRGGSVPERTIRTGYDCYYVYKQKHNCKKIPYLDHGRFYKCPKEKKICIVYHPYLDVEDVKYDVTEWAENNELKAEFYSYSWYYPKRTCMVLIKTPESKIIIPDKIIEESKLER